MSREDAGLVALAGRVRELAGEIGDSLAEQAAATTTVAIERAVLRLCGVSGLSHLGRPLALDVVERYLAPEPRRLSRGIGLPFAVAALEYELEPQQLALEVADGHVDLGLEGELLGDAGRRAAAERTVATWLATAFARFDMNRTARHELIDLLGNPDEPWLGAELRAFEASEAATEAGVYVSGGADLLRVRVPRDSELRRGLSEATDEDDWPIGENAPAPAGSQRGLTSLRAYLDEIAARENRYIRLATHRSGLAAPEHAVVAGFERVDAVFSDPMDAVFGLGVDARRAFADHAFAQRLLARAGATLVLGGGPFVAPELARGADVEPSTIAGRALAMQAISLAFAIENGLHPQRVVLGAVPVSSLAGQASGERALGEVALRDLVFGGHSLMVDEHTAPGDDESIPAAVAAWSVGGARVSIVSLPASAARFEGAARSVRDAVEAAGWLAEGRVVGQLRGRALRHARATLEAAEATLRAVAGSGFGGLLGGEGTIGAAGRATRDSRDSFAGFAAAGFGGAVEWP